MDARRRRQRVKIRQLDDRKFATVVLALDRHASRHDLSPRLAVDGQADGLAICPSREDEERLRDRSGRLTACLVHVEGLVWVLDDTPEVLVKLNAQCDTLDKVAAVGTRGKERLKHLNVVLEVSDLDGAEEEALDGMLEFAGDRCKPGNKPKLGSIWVDDVVFETVTDDVVDDLLRKSIHGGREDVVW